MFTAQVLCQEIKLIRSFTSLILSGLSLSLLPMAMVGQEIPAFSDSELMSVPLREPISALESDYYLGGGDRIRVDIFQMPDLSGDYLVLVDGTLSLPLIGAVKVQGLTLAQLNQLLQAQYVQYLKNPLITTGLITPRPVRVALAGEIEKPGTYTVNLSERQTFPTLTEIIQQAGGLTTVADIAQVEIRRPLQNQDIVIELNLLDLIQQGNLGQDLTLRDGDRIFIPTQREINPLATRQLIESNFGVAVSEIDVAIVGEVYRPGAYTLTPEKTETGFKMPRLTSAIQQSGGIKPLANIRQIQIRRLTRTGREQVFTVDLWNLLQTGELDEDVILQQGDRITIPTATEINPEEAETLASASFSPNLIKVNVVGEVKDPGLIEVAPNTPLNQAILTAGGFDEVRASTGTVELIRLNPNGTVSKREIPVDFANGIDEETNPTLRNNDVVIVSRSGVTTALDVIETITSPFSFIFRLFDFFDDD